MPQQNIVQQPTAALRRRHGYGSQVTKSSCAPAAAAPIDTTTAMFLCLVAAPASGPTQGPCDASEATEHQR